MSADWLSVILNCRPECLFVELPGMYICHWVNSCQCFFCLRFFSPAVRDPLSLVGRLRQAALRCFYSSHPVQILSLIIFMSTTSHIHPSKVDGTVYKASSWLQLELQGIILTTSLSHCTDLDWCSQYWTSRLPSRRFRDRLSVLRTGRPGMSGTADRSISQWLPILRECPARTDHATHTWIIVAAMALTRLRMTDTPASLAV